MISEPEPKSRPGSFGLGDLQSLLSRMAGVGVLAVGDVMVDRFVHGEVTRISAEAPIPIMAHTHEETMLGGCGNVARNIASLGGRVTLVGLVGADPVGRKARDLVAIEGAMSDGLIEDGDRPTTLKTRFVSAGQQLLRVDTETVGQVAGSRELDLIDAIAAAAPNARALLVSDYGKGVVTPAVIEACHVAARTHGLVIVVDSKARGFRHYGPVDVVKPNALELSRATDLPTETDQQIEAALIQALLTSEARAILVTRAAKGMSLLERGGIVRHFRRPPPEVFDTSGAGDTALAALGLALATGVSLETAVHLALIASSVVVEKAGTAVATPAEILVSEETLHATALDGKIATAERMEVEARRWRGLGLKVGFTNGCFDLLHPGHVAYLAQARAWCDRLIVGLNSDESVRAAKGDGRPVNRLDARARVLAGLAAVDLVVAFDEATPLSLIKSARPDLLVKGGDYAVESIVGAAEVKSWGGEVRVADFHQGHSTTGSLRRLREAG